MRQLPRAPLLLLSLLSGGCIDVEPDAVVDDLQGDRFLVALQLNFDTSRAAVLDRVLHGFLRDAEQTERDIVGQDCSDVF